MLLGFFSASTNYESQKVNNKILHHPNQRLYKLATFSFTLLTGYEPAHLFSTENYQHRDSHPQQVYFGSDSTFENHTTAVAIHHHTDDIVHKII